MGRLDGKVALISGGARGQGASHGRQFVAEGARVVLGDVLDGEGKEVAAELGDAAIYTHLDVTREDDWQAAVALAIEHFGKLNVLVNNAGIVKIGTIEQSSLADYMAVISVNQVGCFLGMKTAIPALRSAGGGSIVNISSTAGMEGISGVAAYAASKWAIRGMTKCAALEAGHDGIRVNSVHPGGIDTPMTQSEEFDAVDKDTFYAHLPVPRIGKPADVSRLVLFLASDESDYCTGTEFVIDGGQTTGHIIGGMEGD
jgi:3alpha(or 20beta)-hydroxysteroid dehydrogenase